MYSKWERGKPALDTGSVDPPLTTTLSSRTRSNAQPPPKTPFSSSHPRSIQDIRYQRQRHHDYTTLSYDLVCQTRYLSRSMLNSVNPVLTFPTTSLSSSISSQDTLLPYSNPDSKLDAKEPSTQPYTPTNNPLRNHTHLYSLFDNLPPPSYSDLINQHPLADILVEDGDREHLREYRKIYQQHQQYQTDLIHYHAEIRQFNEGRNRPPARVERPARRSKSRDVASNQQSRPLPIPPAPPQPPPIPPPLPDHRVRFNHSKLPPHFIHQELPHGLTLTPTIEEWMNTNKYFKEITQKYAYEHGIIRIIPPKGYQPVFSLDPDTTVFPTRTQAIGRFGTKGGQTIPGREWTVSTYYHATQLFGGEINKYIESNQNAGVSKQLSSEPLVWFERSSTDELQAGGSDSHAATTENLQNDTFVPLSSLSPTSQPEPTFSNIPELSFQSFPAPFPRALKALKDTVLLSNLNLHMNIAASNIAQERVYLYNLHREHDAMMTRNFHRSPIDLYASSMSPSNSIHQLTKPAHSSKSVQDSSAMMSDRDTPAITIDVDCEEEERCPRSTIPLPYWLTSLSLPSEKTTKYYHMLDKLARVHDTSVSDDINGRLAQFWSQMIDFRADLEENVLQQRLSALADAKIKNALGDEETSNDQRSTLRTAASTSSIRSSTPHESLTKLNIDTLPHSQPTTSNHNPPPELSSLQQALLTTRHSSTSPTINFSSTSMGKVVTEPTAHTNSLLYTIPTKLDNIPTGRSTHSTLPTYSWVKYYARRIVLLGMLLGLQQDTLSTLQPVDYIPIMLEFLHGDKCGTTGSTDQPMSDGELNDHPKRTREVVPNLNQAQFRSSRQPRSNALSLSPSLSPSLTKTTRLLTFTPPQASKQSSTKSDLEFDWTRVSNNIRRFLRIKSAYSTAKAIQGYQRSLQGDDKKRSLLRPPVDIAVLGGEVGNDLKRSNTRKSKSTAAAAAVTMEQTLPHPLTVKSEPASTPISQKSTTSGESSHSQPQRQEYKAKPTAAKKTAPLKPKRSKYDTSTDHFSADNLTASQSSQQQPQQQSRNEADQVDAKKLPNPSRPTSPKSPIAPDSPSKSQPPLSPSAPPKRPSSSTSAVLGVGKDKNQHGVQILSKNPQTSMAVAITYQETVSPATNTNPNTDSPPPTISRSTTKYLQPSRFYGHIFDFENVMNIRTTKTKASQQRILATFSQLLTYILTLSLQPSVNSPSLLNPSNLSLATVTNTITGILIKNALLSPLPFPFPHFTPPRFHAPSEHVKIMQLERIWSSAITFGFPHIVVEYGKDLPTFHVSAHPHPFSSREQETNPYHDDRNVLNWDDQLVWNINGQQQQQHTATSRRQSPHHTTFPLLTPPSSPSSSTVLSEQWNPHTIAFLPGSLLAPIGIINGITKPWLYLGTYFSSFPWHIEDDYLYSMSTNLTNAPKVWFGIPSSHADFFEELFSRFTLLGFASLHTLSNILTPQLLLAFGIRCTRLVQEPGHIILTTPRGYHSGYSAGFSCAEAVNLAVSPWLPFGRFASMKYRLETNRESVFSVELLVIRACLIEPMLHWDDAGDGMGRENTLARTLNEIIQDMKEIFSAYFPEYLHLYDIYLRNHHRSSGGSGVGGARRGQKSSNRREEQAIFSIFDRSERIRYDSRPPRSAKMLVMEEMFDPYHYSRVRHQDFGDCPADFMDDAIYNDSDDNSEADSSIEDFSPKLHIQKKLHVDPTAMYQPLTIPAQPCDDNNGHREHYHLLGEGFIADPATLSIISHAFRQNQCAAQQSGQDVLTPSDTIDITIHPHHCIQLSANHQPIFIPHQISPQSQPITEIASSSHMSDQTTGLSSQQVVPPNSSQPAPVSSIYIPIGLESTTSTTSYREYVLKLYAGLIQTYKDEFIFQYLYWIYQTNPQFKSPFDEQQHVSRTLDATFYRTSCAVENCLNTSSKPPHLTKPSSTSFEDSQTGSKKSTKAKAAAKLRELQKAPPPLTIADCASFRFQDTFISSRACTELRSQLAIQLALSADQFDLYPDLVLPTNPNSHHTKTVESNNNNIPQTSLPSAVPNPPDALPSLNLLLWFTEADLQRVDTTLFPASHILSEKALLHSLNAAHHTHAFTYMSYLSAVDYYYSTYHPEAHEHSHRDAKYTITLDNTQFLTIPDSMNPSTTSPTMAKLPTPSVKSQRQMKVVDDILSHFPQRCQIQLYNSSVHFYSNCYTPPIRIRLLDYERVFQYLKSALLNPNTSSNPPTTNNSTTNSSLAPADQKTNDSKPQKLDLHQQSLLQLLPLDNDIWVPECDTCHQFCWNGFVICARQLASHSANLTHAFSDPTSSAPPPPTTTAPKPVTLDIFLDVWTTQPHIYRRELAELQVFCPYHAKSDTVCACTVETDDATITTNEYTHPITTSQLFTDTASKDFFESALAASNPTPSQKAHIQSHNTPTTQVTTFVSRQTKYASCQEKYFFYRFELHELEMIRDFAFRR